MLEQWRRQERLKFSRQSAEEHEDAGRLLSSVRDMTLRDGLAIVLEAPLQSLRKHNIRAKRSSFTTGFSGTPA